MSQYAILREGAPAEIFEAIVMIAGREIPLAERYHPDLLREMVPYDAAAPRATAVKPSLTDLQAALRQAVTVERRRVECAGITLPSGVRVSTEKDDQDRITSVMVNAERAGIEAFDFKAASGWITINQEELQHIATAIARHVQTCFSAERAHHEAIDALDKVAAATAYDVSQGWPT